MTGSFRIQGLIGSVIGRKASILTNKPRAHLGCAGVPDGHPELKSFLGVPFVELPALAMEEQRHPIDQSALQLDKRVQMEFSDILCTTPSEVVAPNTDVVFTNNGPLKNVAHVPGTAAVVIEKSGAYEIFYAVSAVAGAGARIALTVNGVADQTTTLTVLATPEIVSGKVILNLRAGQILTLRNISATPITLAAAPEVGAQLTLERLGDIEDGENQRNET